MEAIEQPKIIWKIINILYKIDYKIGINVVGNIIVHDVFTILNMHFKPH